MMPARRCSPCGLNWPDDYTNYKTCLECGEKTDGVGNAEPMSDSEVNHRKFEMFFKEWEEKRVAEVADLEVRVAAAPSIPDPDTNPPPPVA